MKISLSLFSVGMIAAAASAGSTDFFDHSGVGLQMGTRSARSEAVTSLFSADFNSYTTGVVCTDRTGGTMGQDNWWQFSSGTYNAFAISAATSGNKNLRASWGTSGTSSASTNWLWQDNAGGGYAPITGFNGGFEADFNLTRFSNTLSTKKGQTQFRTYDVTVTQTATGFIFDNYATGTQPSIRGLAYLNTGTAATTGTYAFTLATGSATTSMGVGHDYYCAYERWTGFIYWGWDVGLSTEQGFFFDPQSNGYILTDQIINEADFLSVRNTATSAGFMDIDNVGFFAYDDIPAPGAAALLGLAGLAGRRRRA
ncbi:MAG: hypothetical protein K8R92_11740 [Planctomycetes bacterium]|nr:hypothetical protein [Planctomycetota bacterium]